MARLNTILENLGRAQTKLLRAADGVPLGQWTTGPGKGRWSAGELVCHLITVERAVISGADKLLQKTPKKLPFDKRFHHSNGAGGISSHPAQIAPPDRPANDSRKRRNAGGIARFGKEP